MNEETIISAADDVTEVYRRGMDAGRDLAGKDLAELQTALAAATRQITNLNEKLLDADRERRQNVTRLEGKIEGLESAFQSALSELKA